MHFSRRTLLAGLGVTLTDLATNAAPQSASPSSIILRADEAPKRFSPDFKKEASVYRYNKSESGSLIRLKKGELLNVRLENALSSPTSIHWYGMRGTNAMDGVAGLTQMSVKQGEVFNYNFMPPDSGLFWYHPLNKGSAAEQQNRGLYGLIIIEEPDAPSVDQDIAVIIDDWNLKSDGEIDSDQYYLKGFAQGGRLGNFLTVNGNAAPEKLYAKSGGRIRLRFLNATGARVCPLKFTDIQAHVIAIDGQACDPFDPLRRTVILSPGSRFDIIVDISADENKTGEIGISLGKILPLLSITSIGVKSEKHPPLLKLSGNNLPAAIRLQNSVRTELVITGGQSAPVGSEPDLIDKTKIWQINNSYFIDFGAKPLFTVRRGTPIVINIANKTAWPQVIHVHGHNFRLLHAFDDGWEPYFLDTLFIADGRNSLISFIADNPGKWAIRSSILDHFEGGVVTWFEVI